MPDHCYSTNSPGPLPRLTTMSSRELDQLRHCQDLQGLQAVLRRLCSRYGRLTRLTILPANHVGKHQALCFLRMASAAQEQHIITALGVGRFGGELVLVVDLQPEMIPHAASRPSMAAAAMLETVA